MCAIPYMWKSEDRSKELFSPSTTCSQGLSSSGHAWQQVLLPTVASYSFCNVFRLIDCGLLITLTIYLIPSKWRWLPPGNSNILGILLMSVLDRHAAIQRVWKPTGKLLVESLLSGEKIRGIPGPKQQVHSFNILKPPLKTPRKNSDLSSFFYSRFVHLPEVLAISWIELNAWPHLLRIGVMMTYFSLI
jgi:hypothetical protein